MKLSISEARKRLPALVHQLRGEPGSRIFITVHDEVVAELRAAQPEPEPGAAARALAGLMSKISPARGRKTRVSSRKNVHLSRTFRTSRT